MNKFHKISLEQWIKDGGIKDGYENIQIPMIKTKRSAGHDFVAPYDIKIEAGNSFTVNTGVKCELDEDKVLKIYPRSSLGIKKNISLKNTVAIIDCDYYNNINNEGHILVCLKNNGKETVEIKQGEAFCQGLIVQFFVAEGSEGIDERIGGIGSTSV